MIYTAHEYQAFCIWACINLPALALWLECGLGKTIITLTAIMELKYNRLTVSKVLIIAPKKVSEATWQREKDKWEHLKMLRFSTVLGTAKQRIKALNAPADIYVINRDNVAWIVEYYKNDWPFDMVVLDEASSFKNKSAIRFKKLKAIRPHITRLIELTGTPAPKDALDVWAQVFLLDQGERLGKTYTACRDAYFSPARMTKNSMGQLVGTGYHFSNEQTQEAFYTKLRDICISLKAADYITMPDKIIDDIPVVLDAQAQKQYDVMERDMVLEVAEDTLDVGSAAALRNKLQQIGDGAAYLTENIQQADGTYLESRRVVDIHDNKLEALTETLEQLGSEHAVIFYAFQHDRDRILAVLAKDNRFKGKVTKLFGGAEDELAWNAGKIDYLLAHPASCAYGLNIQDGGHHAIWFGLTDSLELYIQANARLHRQGQAHTVFIHRLIVQGGVDEDIVAGIEGKDACQEILLQRMKARIEKVKGGIS